MSRFNSDRIYVASGLLSAVQIGALVDQTKSFIKDRYVKNSHHVGCILLGGDGQRYQGLHIDSDGFDVCAETVALGNAMLGAEKNLLVIVSAYWNGQSNREPVVISPCGNCLQLLIKYAPDINVVVPKDGRKTELRLARELLPFAYHRPA